MDKNHSISENNQVKKPENHKYVGNRDVMPGNELWTDGLICAFEFVQGRGTYRKSTTTTFPRTLSSKKDVENSRMYPRANEQIESSAELLEPLSPRELKANQSVLLSDNKDSPVDQSGEIHTTERLDGSRWVPIGWARISELVQLVQTDGGSATQMMDIMDELEDDITVEELAAPYWERPAGPMWWCHVAASHASVQSWLSNAQWLHPAISLALRDDSRLIGERMKYLRYEVPVRVAGGLLFELLGQSAGDPFAEEDNIPVVLRSWQARNFLITALHIKGPESKVNVLGITEVQELLSAGGHNAPKTVHEVIALLALRLTRWDDRLFRKSIFGTADEIELKFMNRRNREDMNLLSVILNQDIRRLSRQVIRVKWSLQAREEIVFELFSHLRGNAARSLLDDVIKSTREMMEEQEAIRGRLFTIQDVMQNTVRAWLQDRSLRVTHNLAVFGGCGLVLSTITGLFGINLDGIPGTKNTPYAFGIFTAILFFIGAVLVGVGLLYLGLKKPVTEKEVEVRKLELQELVKMFQHEAETHAQVSKNVRRNNLTPTAGGFIDDMDYVLIQ